MKTYNSTKKGKISQILVHHYIDEELTVYTIYWYTFRKKKYYSFITVKKIIRRKKSSGAKIVLFLYFGSSCPLTT